MVVPCPRYGHEVCGFKLFMQTFIYKLIPKKKRRGVEVEFYVIWSTIKVGKEKLDLIKKTKTKTKDKRTVKEQGIIQIFDNT